ncbi:hypothetical protein [Flavisolibacter nicotianae]|uniref:hypothetical protein n=1 Tax=Flavisolibacter nicotianae TaxID=2364882 RepID=UPI0013C3EA27|nr:hypothetical protein [Flavisolibacter nicotianae]
MKEDDKKPQEPEKTAVKPTEEGKDETTEIADSAVSPETEESDDEGYVVVESGLGIDE